MNQFEDLVLQYINRYSNRLCQKKNKYSPAGKIFCIDNEFCQGCYWYYETNNVVVDIHDLFIKKEYIDKNVVDMNSYFYLISNYIISGSGEWLEPYSVIEPSSMFIMDVRDPLKKYILHANSRYHSVGMKFKRTGTKNSFLDKMGLSEKEITKIFMDTQKIVTKEIGKISEDILNCKMEGMAADIFFDAKAQEWLSITLNAYKNIKKEKPLSKSDEQAIENVAKYIEDHYAFDISQEFLEQIATMSKTKLKNLFKQKYQMPITEFTQRKRMNVAENLLLSTDLTVGDIAKSVGYNSCSRFSTLFKRYKGIYPKEVKKIMPNSCSCEHIKNRIEN